VSNSSSLRAGSPFAFSAAWWSRMRLVFVAVLIVLAAQMLLEAFGIHLGRHAP